MFMRLFHMLELCCVSESDYPPNTTLCLDFVPSASYTVYKSILVRNRVEMHARQLSIIIILSLYFVLS